MFVTMAMASPFRYFNLYCDVTHYPFVDFQEVAGFHNSCCLSLPGLKCRPRKAVGALAMAARAR